MSGQAGHATHRVICKETRATSSPFHPVTKYEDRCHACLIYTRMTEYRLIYREIQFKLQMLLHSELMQLYLLSALTK